MLQHGHGYHAKNFQTNTNEIAESIGSMGGIGGPSAMSQSYRNVGSAHNSANASAAAKAQAQNQSSHGGNIYEKLRNSYQSPNQYMANEMIGVQGGVGGSVGSGSFHHQKSPKVSGHNGIKQIKLGGNAHSYSGQSKAHPQLGGHGQQAHYHPHQKNVKIMLVGNNGSKGGNPQSFKANIVDQSSMQYMAGGNLPKTTKNNVSKFYSNGQGSQDLSGGFLNALSTPQNKQNSFRNDVIRGVQASMSTGPGIEGTVTQNSSNQMSSGLNIRQSAQIDRKANNSKVDGSSKNTNSQQFSNVQFNQAMMTANGSKSRPGHATNVTMGSEMQSSHGHSKSMSNAHGTGPYN